MAGRAPQEWGGAGLERVERREVVLLSVQTAGSRGSEGMGGIGLRWVG